MQELTERQIEYLLLYATWPGYQYGLSEAAVRFGVTKPTAFRVVEILAKRGYLTREGHGGVAITDAGRAYVEPLLEPLARVTAWLVSAVGLPPEQAERDARRMIVFLDPETISAILGRYERAGNRPETDGAPGARLRPGLADGAYPVNFRVLKKGTADQRSMGDEGFVHPAELRVTAGRAALHMTPRYIVQPAGGKKHRPEQRGILEQLWYREGETWQRSALGEDGTFPIPLSAVMDEGGRVRVRLRVSIGLLKMPESEADIVFSPEGLWTVQ